MQSTLGDILHTHSRVFQTSHSWIKKIERRKVIGRLNWIIKTIVGIVVFHFVSPEGALFLLVCLNAMC